MFQGCQRKAASLLGYSPFLAAEMPWEASACKSKEDGVEGFVLATRAASGKRLSDRL